MLEDIEKKTVSLKVDLEPRKKEAPEDSDSDSDFVEVTPKDDYEAEARADDTLLGIPFYPQATSSSTVKPAEPQPGTSGMQRSKSGSWKLSEGEAADPTTFAATLVKLKVRSECRRIIFT